MSTIKSSTEVVPLPDQANPRAYEAYQRTLRVRLWRSTIITSLLIGLVALLAT